jgi:hypothetical protein
MGCLDICEVRQRVGAFGLTYDARVAQPAFQVSLWLRPPSQGTLSDV